MSNPRRQFAIFTVLVVATAAVVFLTESFPTSAKGETKGLPDARDFDPRGALAVGDPVSVEKDKDGYTIWTYDYADDAWCVMFSRLRWPLNLGAQDPTELSDTTLRMTYSKQQYVVGPQGEPRYSDPSWSVALNGKPTAPVSGAFGGEWDVIGTLTADPTRGVEVPVTEVITFSHRKLIDGENNIWLQQHDFCDCSGLPDCACTCVKLSKVQLRAAVELAVRSVSPYDGAERVSIDQRSNPQIRVHFSTLPDAKSVNPDTFVVYYFDTDVNKVYVPGRVKQISEVEFAFMPEAELIDGIHYYAQVFSEEEASAENRDKWVKDLAGGPLEKGNRWGFWTMPKLKVRIVPVQVLENKQLVADKPTALRVFVRWDTKADVFWREQVADVEVDDILVQWVQDEGDDMGVAYWRGAGAWQPQRDAKTARRKREYRELTREEESYTPWDKYFGLDSVNYYGFTPRGPGGYQLMARVFVKNSQGAQQPFDGFATVNVGNGSHLGVHMRAVGVGADYGRTGTVDLSNVVMESLRSLKDIYPVAGVVYPPAPTAMAYYKPTTSLWVSDWSTEPAWPWPKKNLLQELSEICARSRSAGCRAMVGLVRPAWLGDLGLTLPSAAPAGALAKTDATGANSFVVAHEVGHLAGFEHIEEPAGEGFNVRTRVARRYSIEHQVSDFMAEDPVEAADNQLWISDWHYVSLGLWTGATVASEAAAHAAELPQAIPATVSTDPLLLAAGAITETTGEVTLRPWYQLDAGEWEAPQPGPYEIAFLDGTAEEIAGYTHPFTASAILQPAAAQETTADEPAFFTLVVPFPPSTARIQIRREPSAGGTILKELVLSAGPPSVSIDPPGGSTWSGPQTLTWQSDAGPRYFAVDVSTDGGQTWEGMAIDLTDQSYTIETAGLPDTAQAMIRVAATDGLRSATDTAGPFVIDNPPLVAYVSPTQGETGVGVNSRVVAGFRDAMNPSTIDETSFTLSGGPFGTVSADVVYDTETGEATLSPKVPLAFATTYTARLSPDVKDVAGEALTGAITWSFTTESDSAPPRPLIVSPRNGAVDVPLTARLSVEWDQALDPASVTPAALTVATAQGSAVNGVVTYDAVTRRLTFEPAAAVTADALYVATIKAGIRDEDGNTTEGDYAWSFITGSEAVDKLAFSGAYADAGLDVNGDALFEVLSITVGAQITATGSYGLRGTLADRDGAEITWAHTSVSLDRGTHFIELQFDGPSIGGHGVDGPYTLTDLTLVRTDGAPSPKLLAVVSQRDAYHTTAYPVGRFPAPLSLSGLPDLVLRPGTTFRDAFNVHDYAQHTILASDQLSYTLMLNSDLNAGVELLPSGDVHIRPEPYWLGSTQVTIRASDGTYTAQDSFNVLVGWPLSLYLPVTVRNNSGTTLQQSRDAWITVIDDDFESDSLGWSLYSWYDWLQLGEGHQWFWGSRDCAAHSGQYSAWAYGGGDDGEITACGADYPNTLGSKMCLQIPVNLKYVGKAEYRAYVWADLAPGDQVCLLVTTDERADADCRGAPYYGVCRSGQTNGWEQVVLDLANVPTLGNLLGQEKVWVAVQFEADESGTRPAGAYVDDLRLRICPEGLTEYCEP